MDYLNLDNIFEKTNDVLNTLNFSNKCIHCDKVLRLDKFDYYSFCLSCPNDCCKFLIKCNLALDNKINNNWYIFSSILLLKDNIVIINEYGNAQSHVYTQNVNVHLKLSRLYNLNDKQDIDKAIKDYTLRRLFQ